MGIRTYKPVTPGLRFRATRAYEHLSPDVPHKPLVKGKKRISGRSGRISVRRRGGGVRRLYRIIDFLRNKYEIPGKIATIEYDPNRRADICLVHYADGEKRYIIAPRGIVVGNIIVSAENADPKLGNSMPLDNIPLGTIVHNVELTLGKGGSLARSAGTYASLMAKEGGYVTLKLPSGEMRTIFGRCRATVGTVGGEEHLNTSLGKAGIARKLGRRPNVRGVVMNPHDHPHGGGEGRTSIGRHPVSKWGMPTKGYKTRNKRKVSNKFITKQRKK